MLSALGLTGFGATFVVYAYLGYKWKRTKSNSWLYNMSATEGFTGPTLTAAKVYSGIIKHPRRHLIVGVAACVVAAGIWIVFLGAHT